MWSRFVYIYLKPETFTFFMWMNQHLVDVDESTENSFHNSWVGKSFEKLHGGKRLKASGCGSKHEFSFYSKKLGRRTFQAFQFSFN